MDAPIQGTNVSATGSDIIKALEEIFFGKVDTNPTETKSL